MKLNNRLAALANMVEQPYEIVWDCCCDHGLLGYKILQNGLVKQVNFVDVVPSIIEKLDTKLAEYGHHLPSTVKWKTYCQSVQDLQIPASEFVLNELTGQIPLAKQLVIISGVGGELIIEMLSALDAKYKDQHIDYLLCPAQNSYKLRDALQSMAFKLVKEKIVIDNKRGYELLLVNKIAEKEITSTGDACWGNHSENINYLHNLIAHYQRIVNSGNTVDPIYYSALRDYNALLNKL